MKAILAKVANELLANGVARDAAARIACSVVIDELIKTGISLNAAHDMVFGDGAWESLIDSL